MAKRLLLLNGAAILCVILFHAAGFGFTAMFAWPHRYREVVSPNYDDVGTTAYYVLRLVEQFVVFAIPAFLFVSGFFVSVLAGRTRQGVDRRAMFARIRSLAVPYLFWSAVVIVGLGLEGRVLSAVRYLTSIVTGSLYPAYYYVPLVIQLYLVAPFIVRLARRNWQAVLAAAAVLQLCVYVIQYSLVLAPGNAVVSALGSAVPKWLFLAHLFWFTFGVVAGLQQQALKQILGRVRGGLLPCAAALYVVGVFEWELLIQWSGSPWIENRITLVDGLYAGTVILSFLEFSDVQIPYTNTLLSLGGRSFGIYLVHGLVMEFVARGLYHLAPWVLSRQLLFQPMLIALGLAGPLLLMAVVNRSRFRSMYSYVFG